MSFAQLESANMFQKAVYGDSNALLLSKLPVKSVIATNAYNHYITCSSAAGTALATGYKTNLGAVGISPDGKTSYESIAEYGQSQGLKVGILTSVFINHATPACFYANVFGRDDYYQIGKQLVSSGFNYFAGGIIKNANEAGKQDIYELARQSKYKVVETIEEFKKLKNKGENVIAGSVEMNGGENICPYIDRGNNIISLADYLKKGIELLDNDKGFFIMCEGGQIDWACHANDLAKSIGEVVDFDNTIKIAMEFYNQHPDETLIVITSDHETGGLSLGSNRMAYEMKPEQMKYQTLSNDAFNARVIKSIKNLSSKVTFEQVMDSVKKYFELGGKVTIDESDKLRLKQAYRAGFETEKSNSEDYMYEKYDPITTTASRILAERAGFGWTSYSHTAMPVPLRAIGVGSELFDNLDDNTQLAPVFRQLMKR